MRQGRCQYLQRHPPSEPLIDRPKDHGHSAGADLLLDQVTSHTATGTEPGEQAASRRFAALTQHASSTPFPVIPPSPKALPGDQPGAHGNRLITSRLKYPLIWHPPQDQDRWIGSSSTTRTGQCGH
jgi:hypothetical protein